MKIEWPFITDKYICYLIWVYNYFFCTYVYKIAAESN